jgi:DNA-directed RNA polymerase subunit beta'
MRRVSFGTDIADFDAVRLSIASAKDIMNWSHGEVTKPETINYRTQKPERDGLFCERIFGPQKDINPHDAKYKGLRSREAAVDKNGELVTRAIVRRERMGHITLAAPVAHTWFLRGTPSAFGLILGMTVKNLERVAYFAAYIVSKVDTEKRDKMLLDLEAETEAAKQAIEMRYTKEAEDEGAVLKTLAEARNKELEELVENFNQRKDQLNSLVNLRLLSETEYRELPEEYQDIITVGMGGQALMDLLKDTDVKALITELQAEVEATKGQRKKKAMKRLKVIEGMQHAGIEPESLCVSVLPVIPPDLRPMVQLNGGRFATSDLNDLYRRVINRNNRLKKLLDLNAPEVIRRNEMRMLQEAVDALIDNGNARTGRAVSGIGNKRRLKSLSDMLKGKQGRFRQNLLGKRVDYSGRSVIVSGPELKIHECGLPKMMALELFKPFVIGSLIAKELAHNIKTATRLIEANDDAIWDALDEVISGKYVLLNRAPTLHRLGILAFQPKLIEGKAIQLHPLVCAGFNADFDGDQMAVHLPIGDKAQEEARDLMTATKNLLKPADGEPVLSVTQDIVLGCYYYTYLKPSAQDVKMRIFTDVAEAEYAFDLGQILMQSPIKLRVKGELRETTLGRVYFNELFPEAYPYQNDTFNKKKLKAALAEVFELFGEEIMAGVADDMKDLGFKAATQSGLSVGMDDYFKVDGTAELIADGDDKAGVINDQFEQGFITNEERYQLTVKNWRDIDEKVLESLRKQLVGKDTSISIAVDSGARGDVSNIKLSGGMKGVVVDATGREIELPIKSNYTEGLSQLEYFIDARAARKGLIDTALKTADSGYLTRRMVDVAQDVFTIEEDLADPGFTVYRAESEDIGLKFASRLTGRYAAEDIKVSGDVVVAAGEFITKEVAAKIDASDIHETKIMSVLTSSGLRGVSRKSYGMDMATGKLIAANQPVGVIAAQSVGEPGTQLTLRTFHASGQAAAADITQGLPRVDELFEARMPKGQAYLADIKGTVRAWEEGQSYIVQIAADSEEPVELKLMGRKANVKSGTDVLVGDVVASKEEGEEPLVAPVSGRVEVTKDSILVSPREGATVRYEIPSFRQLVVKDGDTVSPGDRLTGGSINLHDLMRLKGVQATQRYIINEILKIYAAQGQNIADKHIEVIVRQMFSRVQIEEPGDSLMVTGDIVSRASVVEANEALVADGKDPVVYTQLLLGIAKVSIWSDSFLSAASFQDTTRVLISSAISGRVDKLYGLKENVILGRRIPVGTGAIVDEVLDADVAEEFAI